MSTVTISSFRGINKRRQTKLNQALYAHCSVNTSLHDGALTPFPCPELVCEAPEEIYELYEAKECDCVSFENPTYIANYNNQVFVKEQGQRAYRTSHDAFCDGGSCSVSITAPRSAPNVTADAGEDCEFNSVAYMYTFVARLPDGSTAESPPSPMSRAASCGSSPQLSGMSSPTGGQCVTNKRIYRFDAGFSTGNEGQVQNNSGATLIAQIGANQSTYTDSVSLESASGAGLLTFDFESMPINPDGLGVSAFSLFSWQGNELFISVDGMPHVRRLSGRFCFDCDITTATYYNNAIYVFTERWIYRVDEATGRDGVVSYSNPPYRYEKILPIINPHSVSVGALGISYISKSGVVMINGNELSVISSTTIHSSTFKTQNLRSARTFIYQQYLFVFSRDWDYTHIIEFDDGAYADEEFSNHVIYPYTIGAMSIRNNGCLHFSVDNEIFEFLEGPQCYDWCEDEQKRPLCEECCPYDYHIRPISEAEITDYSSGAIDIGQAGDVTFRLWDKECGSKLIFECTFSGCQEHEFRLPACRLSRNHTIQLEGCADVYELRLSTSSKLLGQNRN